METIVTSQQTSSSSSDTSSQTNATKIRIFFGAWILSEILLGIVLKYIDSLNGNGVIKTYEGFSSEQLFWGSSITINIIHLVILTAFGGVFGFIYGYLRRKVSLRGKILASISNAILTITVPFIIIVIAYLIINGSAGFSDIGSTLPSILNAVFSSIFYAVFFCLNILGIFIASFFFINKGSTVINDPYTTLDKGTGRTLLGIKWFHYFWLWIPIGIYSRLILGCITEAILIVFPLIRALKWYNLFGVATQNGNPIYMILFLIVFISLVIFIIFALLEYLRKVLSGKVQMKTLFKVLLSLLIGIIIPFAAEFLINNKLF